MGKHIFPHTVINMGKLCSNLFTFFWKLQVQFKRELKVEFPQASEERLQAMAQRLPVVKAGSFS